MGIRFCRLCAAVVISMACMVPVAWADDALGDVDQPAASSAQTGSGASSTSTSSVDTSDVQLSADNDAALIDGCSFAVDSFSRAQVGSDREIDGVYQGYCYYIGSSAGNLSLLATDSDVVVYVPADSAAAVGFDPSDAAACDDLKRYLVALDNLNASGGTVIGDGVTWHFTTNTEIQVGSAIYRFDQELKSGSYYACVIGADGSDVTSSDLDDPLKLTHACFGHMVSSDDVALAEQPSWFEQLQNFLGSIDYSPLWVTLKTTGTAIVFIFILGLAAAYFSLRIGPRAQDIADSIFTIPMVLPPTVCGFLLLLALGKNTVVGQWFIDIGFPLIFSWPATVIAAVVVAFPLMYRSARGAFENLDPNMMDAARTLGWSNPKIFFKLMLPLSWSSIAAGTVLAFARALGEFGATLFLAGNYLGVTRTIPIAIYFEWMNGNTDVAIFWTIVIIIFSFIVILFINLWSRRTTKYRRGAIEE